MNESKFTIDGPVQAQQRPRFARKGRHVQTYDAMVKRHLFDDVINYRSND